MIFPEHGGKIPRMGSFKHQSVLSSLAKKPALPLVTADNCLIDLGVVQSYPGLTGLGERCYRKK